MIGGKGSAGPLFPAAPQITPSAAAGVTVNDPGEVRELVYKASGPNFAAVKVLDEKLPLVLPPQDGVLLKDRFRKAVLADVLPEKR